MTPQPGDLCLTVRQPHAWAILAGLKPIENRSWATSYRGRVWIHAAAKADEGAVLPGDLKPPTNLLLGAVLGSVEIADCLLPLRPCTSEWADAGACHWMLRSPEALAEPIRCAGALGLWRFGQRRRRRTLTCAPQTKSGTTG
jgi:hypothetical protein